MVYAIYYHLFMVIWVMVDYCFTYTLISFDPPPYVFSDFRLTIQHDPIHPLINRYIYIATSASGQGAICSKVDLP